MEELTGMGFGWAASAKALAANNNNVQCAIEALISTHHCPSSDSVSSTSESMVTAVTTVVQPFSATVKKAKSRKKKAKGKAKAMANDEIPKVKFDTTVEKTNIGGAAKKTWESSGRLRTMSEPTPKQYVRSSLGQLYSQAQHRICILQQNNYLKRVAIKHDEILPLSIRCILRNPTSHMIACTHAPNATPHTHTNTHESCHHTPPTPRINNNRVTFNLSKNQLRLFSPESSRKRLNSCPSSDPVTVQQRYDGSGWDVEEHAQELLEARRLKEAKAAAELGVDVDSDHPLSKAERRRRKQTAAKAEAALSKINAATTNTLAGSWPTRFRMVKGRAVLGVLMLVVLTVAIFVVLSSTLQGVSNNEHGMVSPAVFGSMQSNIPSSFPSLLRKQQASFLFGVSKVLPRVPVVLQTAPFGTAPFVFDTPTNVDDEELNYV
jgi:hypothetical protein